MNLNKKITLILGIILTGFSLFATTESVFKGKVVRFVEPGPASYIRPGVDGFTGRILWIAPVGTFAKGPLYDAKGNIVKKGDVIALCDKRFYSHAVKEAKGEIQALEGIFEAKKLEYNRLKKLALNVHVVSKSEYDIAKGEYIEMLGKIKSAKSDLEYNQLLVDVCTIRAQYDCLVTKHLNVPGSWTNIDYPTMIVAAISPLYVDVEMNRQLVKRLCLGDFTVKVYPKGSDKEVHAYIQFAMPRSNGIRIPVANHMILPPKDIKLPIVNNYAYITRFETNSTTLSVEQQAIQKDEKGYFLWQAVGQSLITNEPVKSKITVKKIYIEPLDLVRKIDPIGNIQALKNAGSLKLGDIVLNSNIPKNIKDGDSVYYHKIIPLFWVGDEVKVVIPGLKEGTYEKYLEENNSGDKSGKTEISPYKIKTDTEQGS